LIAGLAPPAAAQSDRPRVAILTAMTIEGAPEAELEARAGVESSVRTQGADIVLVAAGAQAACREASCMQDLARDTHATHVLRVETHYARDGYRLQVGLWDAPRGTLVDTRDRTCEVCTHGDLQKAIREITALLCSRLSERPPLSSPPPHEVEVEAGYAAPLGPGELSPSGSGEMGSRLRTGIGIGALVAGMFAVGGGAYVLSLDGKRTSTSPNPATSTCPGPTQGPTVDICEKRYATKTQGWGLAAAGGVAMVAGAILALPPLWHSSSTSSTSSTSPSMSLQLAPNGLVAQGVF
jgi:hypothetical protein